MVDQTYYNSTNITCDGKAEVTITKRHVPYDDGVDAEDSTYVQTLTIEVFNYEHQLVHEIVIKADHIEAMASGRRQYRRVACLKS